MNNCNINEKPKKGAGGIAAGIILSVLISIPVIVGFFAVFYYIFGPSEGYFHADCSDSLYWANASFESGKIFDPTYRYAALLPFSAQLWMTPLIAVFGFGMTAQKLGMAFFALLFAASLFFFCRKAGQSIGWCSATVGISMLVLSSSDKLREIMWGHVIYYSLGLVLFWLMASLALSFIEKCESNSVYNTGKAPERRVKVFCTVLALLLFAVAVGAATDGFQVMVLSTVPLIGGIVAERIFDGKHRLFASEKISSWGSVIILAGGTVAGIVVLKLITNNGEIAADYTGFYSRYSAMSKWLPNAQKFLNDYLKLVGVDIAGGEALVAKETIAPLVRLGMAFLLLACPLFMFIFYRRLSGRGVRIMLWSHLVLCAAVLFGYVCGNLSNANWRLTPLVISGIVLAVAGARELAIYGRYQILTGKDKISEPDDGDEKMSVGGEPKFTADASEEVPKIPEKQIPDEPRPWEKKAERAEKVKKQNALTGGRVTLRIGVIMLAFLMLASVISFIEIKKMPVDFGKDDNYARLIGFLEENGLHYGYATFWHSNEITVRSNSKVLVREAMVSAAKGVYTDYYQSSRRWYDEAQHEKYEKYFVILTEQEYRTVYNSVSWKELVEKNPADSLRCEGFYVFVFENDLNLTE